MTVSIDHLRKPGEVGLQESDLLDRWPIPDTQEVDEASQHIRLVSLGCFCGPKLSFKKIGRGAESLPFDWMRTRMSGILHFLREDFDGFFDFVTKKPVPNTGAMVMYRGYHHSFWHDDPTDPAMHERYGRRLVRFKSIDAHTVPVLFVRACATRDDLEHAVELLEELQSRFGKFASLLLLMDFQKTALGASLVRGHSNLMLNFLSCDIHDSSSAAPYGDFVKVALDWLMGRPISARVFESMDIAIRCCDPTVWGLEGLGGLDAFESEPPLPSARAGEGEAPVTSVLLETGSGVTATDPPADDDVILCSLGCHCGPKLAFQKMGRGAEALPFDWIRVSFPGVLGFFGSDFQDFVNYTTKMDVPGCNMTMYRSGHHSFWHDNPDSTETKVNYGRRIASFQDLCRAQKPILFVRVAATTDEILRVDELLEALRWRFGDLAALLFIADSQHSYPGLHVVEDREALLVSLIASAAPSGDGEDAAAPYVEPVEAGIAWVNGEPMTTSCSPDLEALHQLMDEARGGLVGPGDLDAFGDIPRDAENPAAVKVAPGRAVPANAGPTPLVVPLGCGSVPARAFKTGWSGIAELVADETDLPSDKLIPMLQAGTGQEQLPCFAAVDNAGNRIALFVRLAHSIEEVSATPEIVAALRTSRQRAYLLLLVDKQERTRLLVVENEANVLVGLVQGDCRDVPERCSDHIKSGIGWVSGSTLQAALVKSYDALQGMCAPVSHAPGGASVRALASISEAKENGSSDAGTQDGSPDAAKHAAFNAPTSPAGAGGSGFGGGLRKLFGSLLGSDTP